VLLILASPGDVEAHGLAAAWSSSQAAVVTWSDLSCPGWCYTANSGDAPSYSIGRSAAAVAASCSVGGRVLPAADIDAILTRAATVDPADLVDIAEHDRDYVAAEMHAFLVAWLSALGGRVVNRPTPRSLLGPLWPAEVWVHRAASLSIPVTPTHRRVDPLPAGADPSTGDSASAWLVDLAREPHLSESWSAVTVVGERAFGEGHVTLKHHALALAQAVGTDLLSVTFDGREATARLVTADPQPTLHDEAVVEAVRRYLCARR
jgi:hypothetical protein